MVGLGKGKSGERGVVTVDAGAGGRVLWGVSVEVLVVVDVGCGWMCGGGWVKMVILM